MTAGTTQKKYDVAISFLAEDITLAETLYTKLSEVFEVFFSARRQEELAGTNGAESMREPFLSESRLNVILFKDKWGTTPWTGVESHAIEDSAIKNQFRNVFLLVIEKSSQYPKWLPYSFMRFHLGEYTLEEAIGAIKLRVQEEGGRITPMTPLKRAQQLKEEALYQADKSRMHWDDGKEKSLGKLDELIKEMARHCEEVNQAGGMDLEYEIHSQALILRHEQIGMIVKWNEEYEGSTKKGGIAVEEYKGQLYFNGEMVNRVIMHHPEMTKKTIYDPDLSRSREVGWSKQKDTSEFISSSTLAEKLVMKFMGMIERSRSKTRY